MYKVSSYDVYHISKLTSMLYKIVDQYETFCTIAKSICGHGRMKCDKTEHVNTQI